MRDFQLIVADDRRIVPGLLIVCARDEARVREIAEQVLRESIHYLWIEVLEHGRSLFSVGRTPSPHEDGRTARDGPPVSPIGQAAAARQGFVPVPIRPPLDCRDA